MYSELSIRHVLSTLKETFRLARWRPEPVYSNKSNYHHGETMYIGYDKKNGIKYAKLCSTEIVDGKVVTKQKSLGRVIDEKDIFHNRER